MRLLGITLQISAVKPGSSRPSNLVAGLPRHPLVEGTSSSKVEARFWWEMSPEVCQELQRSGTCFCTRSPGQAAEELKCTQLIVAACEDALLSAGAATAKPNTPCRRAKRRPSATKADALCPCSSGDGPIPSLVAHPWVDVSEPGFCSQPLVPATPICQFLYALCLLQCSSRFFSLLALPRQPQPSPPPPAAAAPCPLWSPSFHLSSLPSSLPFLPVFAHLGSAHPPGGEGYPFRPRPRSPPALPGSSRCLLRPLPVQPLPPSLGVRSREGGSEPGRGGRCSQARLCRRDARCGLTSLRLAGRGEPTISSSDTRLRISGHTVCRCSQEIFAFPSAPARKPQALRLDVPGCKCARHSSVPFSPRSYALAAQHQPCVAALARAWPA
ncbi:coordinator of PRMT5 and differentiation stimulator isoform X1 [Dromaius novaehollandiae]|uniref:coordinator of PRMT5 and differentiation stimulator isoform X1 n=1 Tax=Dromaius novaehollandiae TaxID=8790 RepID=UPI00311D8013